MAPHASWRELLEAPGPASHIVQIYDSDDFLACGVAVFAAEGLKQGDAVLLTGTEAHLAGIRQKLAASGVDVQAAVRNAQLTLADVHAAMAAVLVNGMPDNELFQAHATVALERARAHGRFTGVRCWGEMSNVLYHQGNPRAALAAERLGDAATKALGVRLLCSFHYDKFDARGYEGILREVCCAHTHVIPAEDYVRHRLAVNRAIAEVVGEIRGPLLQSLLSWKGLSCDLPSSQALLFWLRDTMPERLGEVLSRAKTYQVEQPVAA